ncbi:MAG: methionine--tRNA ligase [Candidatus Saccharibacteria bacterium]|nr:methionine--tRNA ligase [Candidatus Saccharibacteria bacterium]
MSKIYLTTAIPYVNGAPHIGHAMDYIIADTCSRYHQICGDEVRLQAGTDEHGNKIFRKATESNMPVEDYVDENAAKFRDFIKKLDVEYTDYIRTTDADHMKRCQEIWRKIKDHIYSATYGGWYCVGCESYVTQKEYDENGGICPDHQKPYEHLEEENYYFRISDFKDEIRAKIESDEIQILPEFRKKEMLKMLEDAPDVSISRPTSQLTWGVPVPDDPNQTMYVWIDALSNYITVLGYPEKPIDEWWPATAQFVGKDILRFHAIIWPAMLLALGLPLPKVLCSHGFILADGQKMSKSIGNVIDPIEVLEKHGADAFRYYFLRHVDTFTDGDFTWEKYESAYNTELANDYGNLVQRLATMLMKNNIATAALKPKELDETYRNFMNNFEFAKAFDYAWEKVQGINKRIDDEKPWMLAKAGETEKLGQVLSSLTQELKDVNLMLSPFLPSAAKKVADIFDAETVTPPAEPLFKKD